MAIDKELIEDRAEPPIKLEAGNKRKPIVTKQELDDSKMDLNTFMNSHEHDGKEWKLRDNPKMRQTMVNQIRRSKQQEELGHSQPYDSKMKKKDPIVSKELLDSKGLNLNSFMNAYKHDGKEWKLRDKPLMRKTMVDAIAREKSGRHAKGGSVKSSASKRGDGIAQRGKTRA